MTIAPISRTEAHFVHEERPSDCLSRTIRGVAAFAITMFTLGIALMFRSVRQLWQDAFFYSERVPNPVLTLEQETALAATADVELIPPQAGEWRSGPGVNEQQQTLEHFCQDKDTALIFQQRKKLKLIPLGDISELEMKCFRIVTDYLRIGHGVEVDLQPATRIEELANRTCNAQTPYKRSLNTHDQYGIEYLLPMLQIERPEANHCVVALTNHDIYAAGMNFLYGYGDCKTGVGIISTHRLASPTSNLPLFLKQLMRTAFHEFGHIRNIEHCTKYKCIMQGASGPAEAAQVPLSLCSQDMAKICHLDGWTLQEGIQKHLTFFENFFRNYAINVDFSQEIDTLRCSLKLLNPVD